jgi:ribosome biogenesis protein MAK21
MAIKKGKKSEDTTDVELLKSDVASFASSIGLASSLPTSGFNDSDFRKKGPLKTDGKTITPKPFVKKVETQDRFKDNQKNNNWNKDKPGTQDRFKNNQKNNNWNKNNQKFNNNSRKEEHPKPKAPVLSIDNTNKYDKFKNLPKLPLVKASSVGVWYMDAAELEEKVIGDKKVEYRNLEEWKNVVAKKKELGERLLAQFAQDYESSRGQSGDIKMLIATQRSGTATDKVSAFSVMIGDNPIANVKSLDALIGMVTSKVGKRHALSGFEALKEMFVTSLLPDRKLKTLVQRPVNHLPETKDGYSLLLFWHWEECLKQRYERFVFALEEASKDVLAILKDKALKTIYVLLKSKSEQERRLLSALVNKLGDPENKAASNADYHLSKLLSDHPNMKAVVIDEVDSFLFRPHLGLRSKYHAVNFLSQIRLAHHGDGPKVAKRLVDVYFSLFKLLISEAGGSEADKKNKEEAKKKTSKSSTSKDVKSPSDAHVEMDSRLLTALLTGVNRAFPFVASSEADDLVEIQTPMLFQLVHSKNFNVGVQALMLLDKISSKNQVVSDRFYRALYSKLLLPAAMTSSKEEMFIGLLLKAMKTDINLKRVSAFAKRLLQISLQQPPQYACGCLFLLSEVLKARPPLWNMMSQSESADDDDIEHFEDIVDETENQEKTTSPEKDVEVVALDSDSDASLDEEYGSSRANAFDDMDSDEGDELIVESSKKDVKDTKDASQHPSKQSTARKSSSLPGGYDPRHREPSYCNADHVSWWELTVLASHVHPSVATMARTLLSGANIVYNGNPLHDLSLTAFLDKLMEKKPKQNTWHGGSQIEPAKKLDMNNQLIGAEIVSLAEMDVAPEDVVFHKFYINKMTSSKKPKKKKKKQIADDEAADDLTGGPGDDDSDNEEIDNMLDSVNHSMEAEGEYDYDDLDQIANEDDDDLVGDLSDGDEGMDFPSDIAEGEEDDEIDNKLISDDDYDGEEFDIGDADDGSEEEEGFDEEEGKRKRKGGKKKARASPFASLDDYEHLLNEDISGDNSPDEKPSKSVGKDKKHKSKKKRKISK